MREVKKWNQLLASILAASIILTGCTSGKAGKEEKEAVIAAEYATIDSTQLAASSKEKYAESEKYEYAEPMKDLEKDHIFELEINFDHEEKGYEDATQLVTFYADSNFTVQLHSKHELIANDDGSATLTSGPWSNPVMGPREESGKNVFDSEQYSDWGNLSQYYMVQYVDTESGDALEKPIVTVFSIKRELDAPKTAFNITEDGQALLSWNEVEGADRYYVVSAYYEGNTVYTGMIEAEVTDTQYIFADDKSTMMNSSFKTAYNSHCLPSDSDEDKEAVQVEGTMTHDPTPYKENRNYYYAVIAANDEGQSNLDVLHKLSDIAARLPYTIDTEKMEEEDIETQTRYIPSIGVLPAQVPVTMCDGSISYKTVVYDMKGAKTQNEQWYEYDEDEEGNPINITQHTGEALYVPYSIEGTIFGDTYKITNYEKDTYEEELEKVAQRQEELQGKSGTDNSNNGIGTAEQEEQEEQEEQAGEETEIVDVDTEVFANSALSEYIALNLLGGNTYIDLSEFPESSDEELLADAYMEAYYQNPLILGVEGAYIASDEKVLAISYEDDTNTRVVKQREIMEKVHAVVEEIITDDMTDLEKEFAINDYLCENAEYDMAALEDAEKNNFETVDAKYNDSFTAYGIMVNGVGVCASYAAAFKLLADEAGLESIVTTGYLEGTLPHAWNRVNIEDEWHTVDVTNNDNPYMFNALLNLPDDVSASVLVEDSLFVLDGYLADYSSTDGEKEYYKQVDKFFDKEEIVTQLVNELEAGGTALLRTDYALDDVEFSIIADEVMKEMEIGNLYGFYWLGVINLSLEYQE